MKNLPNRLQAKLDLRDENKSLRRLSERADLIDFSSNDYIGFASSKNIFDQTHQLLVTRKMYQNGATGSRLLSGNHDLYRETEDMLADFYNAESALIFNSGYDANVGFFSSIAQRGDIIFYDELIHASIRDGIKISNAKSYKFAHNNISDLQKRLQQNKSNKKSSAESFEVYIVTESVFSMDGDIPDLQGFVTFCKENNCHLIVDEAHATGVFGKYGVGILQGLGIENNIFARIHTFGKALGCHGAVILGSNELKKYLINFARSFIYTTGLPPHSLATIQSAHAALQTTDAIDRLTKNITFFNQNLDATNLKSRFIKSNSAIHCCIISGNEHVQNVARQIQKKGFNVKPILSPTVPVGEERLRFCIHAYNSKDEITNVLNLLATFVREYAKQDHEN
ncbi:aminotransferase class I/II-fold pyridoxal phosphate-dependent enzyme [Aquimarina sp. W85]|uniref:aminotransferase class I/II-fold pyridoxal phosphate-dependent enzyme n=1 Tax=Aquimarina rhodophyticola TaxID=3342246 RepID=UPI00366A8B52